MRVPPRRALDTHRDPAGLLIVKIFCISSPGGHSVSIRGPNHQNLCPIKSFHFCLSDITTNNAQWFWTTNRECFLSPS